MKIKNIMVLIFVTLFLCACVSHQAVGIKEPKAKKISKVEKFQQYQSLRYRGLFLSNYWKYINNPFIRHDVASGEQRTVLVIQAFTFAIDGFNDRPIDFVDFFIVEEDVAKMGLLMTEYMPTINELVAYGCDGCSNNRKDHNAILLDENINDDEIVFLMPGFRLDVLDLFSQFKNTYNGFTMINKEKEKTPFLEKEIFRQVIGGGDNEVLVIHKISNMTGNGKWNKVFIGFKDKSCTFDNNGWYVKEVVVNDEQNKLLEKFQKKNSCEITPFNLELGFSDKIFYGRWYTPCAFPTDLISETSSIGWRYLFKDNFVEIEFFGYRKA